MAAVDPTHLQQRWIHSHEEDTPAGKVFRPASYKLPPARGRRSFELKPDGRLVTRDIGPDDRGVTTEGTWALEGGDVLRMRLASGRERVYRIADASGDRLVLRGGT
jgi:hypothetical protein